MLKSAFMFIARCCVATTVVTTVAPPTAAAATYHVDDDSPVNPPNTATGATWATSFKYLQDALDVANPGDTIKVAGGSYRADQDAIGPITHTPNDRTESFALKATVVLQGSYAGLSNPTAPDVQDMAHPSILTGDIGTQSNASDNSFHVVTGGDANSDTLLRMFTIKLGNGDGNTGGDANRGAGIYLVNDNEPRIENCIIEYCTVDEVNGYGGGIFIGDVAAPVLTGLTLRHNVGGYGGGIGDIGGGIDVRIENCDFNHNSAHTGGGLFTQRTSFVYRSNFSLNTAPAVLGHFNGGAAVAAWANIELRECDVISNTAIDSSGADIVGGGVYIDSGSGTLVRCIISDNHIVTTGGLMSAQGGGASLHPGGFVTNCVFQGNSIVDDSDDEQGIGGGLIVSKGATVTNSLFFDNRARQAGAIWVFDPTVAITNCTVTRNTATGTNATGGIYYDPQFFFDSGTAIQNNVIWGNLGTHAAVEDQQIFVGTWISSVGISHNIIEGRIATGQYDSDDDIFNLDADPMFYDEPNDNFRLKSCSRAIDYGDTPQTPIDTLGVLGAATASCSSCVGNRTWDLDLHYRVTDMPRDDHADSELEDSCQRCGLVVDLGAYERHPLGDLNFDGVVNGLDIQPFTDCVKGNFGNPPSLACMNADTNEDGLLSFDDVTCFISLLLGQPGCVSCDEGGGPIDCNENDVADAIDIREGDSQDCNGNGIPDECDIASETSNDVDSDGQPDECAADCNSNGLPDSWEISEELVADINANGIPDACDPDCDADGQPDDYELTHGADDCNQNGTPDSCEYDCNANGVPDDCDVDPLDPDGDESVSEDCNSNGIPDECDLERPILASFDCNDNQIPDECDIASSTSLDANTNGIPDECEEESLMSGGGGESMMGGNPHPGPLPQGEGGGEGGGEFDEAAAWEAFFEWYEAQIFGEESDWHTLTGSQRFERVMDELQLLGLPYARPW